MNVGLPGKRKPQLVDCGCISLELGNPLSRVILSLLRMPACMQAPQFPASVHANLILPGIFQQRQRFLSAVSRNKADQAEASLTAFTYSKEVWNRAAYASSRERRQY